MDDLEKWRIALQECRDFYCGLPDSIRVALDQLTRQFRLLKEELLGLSLQAGGLAACQECGGLCCLYGKYHLTLLDQLACFSAGFEPKQPDFSKHPACPYGGDQGCLMSGEFRPFTCVIFNCESIEAAMTIAVKGRFAECELELRNLIAGADQLLGIRSNRPLLLAANLINF